MAVVAETVTGPGTAAVAAIETVGEDGTMLEAVTQHGLRGGPRNMIARDLKSWVVVVVVVEEEDVQDSPMPVLALRSCYRLLCV